jgi:hypothetical protein
MNTRELQRGDRVRVTASNRMEAYHAGDKGTVRRFHRPTEGDDTAAYYDVAMDRDPVWEHALFRPDEIEADV